MQANVIIRVYSHQSLAGVVPIYSVSGASLTPESAGVENFVDAGLTIFSRQVPGSLKFMCFPPEVMDKMVLEGYTPYTRQDAIVQDPQPYDYTQGDQFYPEQEFSANGSE
ncbi:hypothetical protein IWQ56_001248 [Coemansia nantahalensis]|nr:hypothetical protein IWQ56_001248 [Coemansia nantahalensis]